MRLSALALAEACLARRDNFMACNVPWSGTPVVRDVVLSPRGCSEAPRLEATKEVGPRLVPASESHMLRGRRVNTHDDLAGSAAIPFLSGALSDG